jgi:hypothetical protein
VLADFRAPYRGRSSAVAAWWGTFDLGVSLFSGRPAVPPADDFITRNSADAQEVVIGWWAGDARYPRAAFYGFAYPAVPGLDQAIVSPAGAHWDHDLGEFILDWDDVRTAEDPHAAAVLFARSVFRHASAMGDWDSALVASVEKEPPPLH